MCDHYGGIGLCDASGAQGGRAEPVGVSGAPQRGAADGGPRCHDREHRAAVGSAGASFLVQRPRVDRHRVCAGVRQLAAAGRQAWRRVRTQVDLHRRARRLRRRLGDRRPGHIVFHACHRPGAPRSLRRAAGAVCTGTVDRDIRGQPGSRHCVRDLRRDRWRRCVARAVARRSADPGSVLEMVPLREPSDRRSHGDRRAPPARQSPRPRAGRV